MAWKETSARHWQRPIGENEAMIKMIGDGGWKSGKDVWSIAVTATFIADIQRTSRNKPLCEVLMDGWKVLRFHHPSIATTASKDILEYDTPISHELEQWVAESFVLVDGHVSPDDIITGFTPRRFATLYYLKEHSSIILNTSHWRTDGIGAFHLLDAYFEATIESLQKEPLEMPWGEEVARLVPSVEGALDLATTPTSDIQRATKQFLNTLAYNIDAIGTPYLSGDKIISGGTRGTQLRFSQAETTELKSRCHQLEVSLEAAVHASVTATAYSIAGLSSVNKHHSTTMRHSVRPHLPTPYDGVAGAAGLYTAGYIVKVPASQSWLENAKYYEAEYSKGATPDLLSSRRQYAVVMKDILKNLPTPSSPPSGLDISCIPDAQTLIKPLHASSVGSFEISGISIGVDLISRHLYLFIWTFNEQLEARLVYNEAFYDASFVESILETIKEHLFSSLQCQPSTVA